MLAAVSDIDPRLISGERLVYTTHKHWAGLITQSVWAILMIVAAVLLAWIQPDTSGGVLGFINRVVDLIRLALFLGGCGWIAYNVVAWRTAGYTVTNLRVLCHEGLIRRRSSDTLLSSLADLRLVIPAFGSLLGYGNIRIISAGGSAGEDAFTAVRDAEGFKRQVLEQKAALATATAVAPADGSARPSQAPAAGGGWNSTDQLLGQLANLRDAGVLTPDEYEAKKTLLLSRV
jgi:hypothetical protein